MPACALALEIGCCCLFTAVFPGPTAWEHLRPACPVGKYPLSAHLDRIETPLANPLMNSLPGYAPTFDELQDG